MWVWQAHRDKANATMIDSDDVLLLHTEQEVVVPKTPFTATLCYFDSEVPGAGLRTLNAENTFPQLPTRLGENVLVLLGPGDVPPEAVKTQLLRLG